MAGEHDNDGSPELVAALALLAAEDPAAADDASAALDWITADAGDLALLTQQSIQDFCWYELPVKWMNPAGGSAHVADSLARALDLLQMPRYAEICRSETTREILAAYEDGAPAGLKAYRRAVAASGITPPDLPDFEWGELMGACEASAWLSVAHALELAIASGTLRPGKRGWRERQRELTRTHLDIPREELLGQPFSSAIVSERAETWVSHWRSPTRQQAVGAIANRLLHPVQLPEADAADPLPRWRWLLTKFDEGIPLTQTGNLARAFVQDSAARFGWDEFRPPRTEDELADLHLLRGLATGLRLARRSGRLLTLTAKGRQLTADPPSLWKTTARALLAGDAFHTYTGEMFLTLLLLRGTVPADEVTAAVARAVTEEAFHDSRTGLPPGEHDVRWAMYDTVNRCRALGLLVNGDDWRNRTCELTPAGTATALEALHARAVGPNPNF